MFETSRPHGGAVALMVLLLAGLLSGCVGDDDPAPAETTTEPGDDAGGGVDTNTPTKTDRPVTQIDDASSVLFAPSYKGTEAWTYDVAGQVYPAGFTAKFGIVEVTDAGYVFGTDSDDALKNFAHKGSGLFLGGVEKETLNIQHDGASQDLFGFQRSEGDEWTFSLYGTAFKVTKAVVADVQHGAGSGGEGIRVSGTAPDEGTIVVEYAKDVGGLSLLSWTDADGAVELEWKLTQYSATGASGLKRWEISDQRQGDASGPPNNLGYDTWESDGSGATVFARVVIDSAAVARATLIDPANQVAFEVEGGPDGRVVEDFLLDDQAGTWHMVMTTTSGLPLLGTALGGENSGRVDMFLYQVQEVTA